MGKIVGRRAAPILAGAFIAKCSRSAVECEGLSGSGGVRTGAVLGRGGRDLVCTRFRLVVYRVACFAPSAHDVKDDFY
jgi:hypothetical protein